MLVELKEKDVSLSVENGNLAVETSSKMTETERDYLRKNKHILIENLNKQKCTKCIHLFPCPNARNISGACPNQFQYTVNKHLGGIL